MRQVFKLLREQTTQNPSGENFTLGRMYLDNVFFCHTCEDEDRFIEKGGVEKVYGRTAIPRGKYRLVTSFSNHFQRVLPELLDVPGFSGIRIHGGNRAEDSLGCILVGKVRTATGIAQCADMVSRVISQIDSADELGIETWLEVA